MHVQGQNRDQATLFPERLDDLIGEDNDDDDEPQSGGGNTRAVLEALEAQRGTLTERIQAMHDAGLDVQPETDPEARVLGHGRVGYNVQSSVDSKHRLIVDVDVVQSAADQDQLYRMARRSGHPTLSARQSGIR